MIIQKKEPDAVCKRPAQVPNMEVYRHGDGTAERAAARMPIARVRTGIVDEVMRWILAGGLTPPQTIAHLQVRTDRL